MDKKTLAAFIDHTCLKQDMTNKDLEKLCMESIENEFFSICIPPIYVTDGKKALAHTTVKTITVVGFPLGYNTPKAKAFETYQCLTDGAEEIDMVASVAHLKNKNFAAYQEEIQSLKKICEKVALKVIIETSLLTPEEITNATKLCVAAGADFIKTSTGFGQRGASLTDIDLIQKAAPNTEIKASGGIRTTEDALQYINKGVKRIGTSNGIAIINGLK